MGVNRAAIRDQKGELDLSGVKVKNAILDTGASYALIPSSDFEAITSALSTGYGVECKAPEGEQTMTSVHSCDCANFYENLPDIGIQLVGKMGGSG